MESKGSRKRQRLNLKSQHMESQLQELLFGKEDVSGSIEQDDGLDEIEIMVDRNPDVSSTVWLDEDDGNYFNSSDVRLKKLSRAKHPTNVSGSDMSSLLQERFQTQPLEWAQLKPDDIDEARSILCRTSALLQPRQGGYLDAGFHSNPRDRLQPVRLAAGTLQIARAIDANAESPSDKAVTAVRFHASSGVMLAAGLYKDSTVNFASSEWMESVMKNNSVLHSQTCLFDVPHSWVRARMLSSAGARPTSIATTPPLGLCRKLQH